MATPEKRTRRARSERTEHMEHMAVPEKGGRRTKSSHTEHMEHMAQPEKKRHPFISGALILVGTVMLAAGGFIIYKVFSQQAAYTSLSEEVAVISDSEAAEEDADIDWDYLLSINPEVVGWLTVEGTSIDLPVVQVQDDKEDDYYLHHDLWGNYSSSGCLYLDARSDADGVHMLIYGHHLTGTSLMFSEIFQTYYQDQFDTIGVATWSTPDVGDTTFTPVMAMTVDKTYATIQDFEFPDEESLRTWLLELSEDATAFSDTWEEDIEGATRVLTLVTCSSLRGGQRARTLLIFVA